VKFAAGMTEEIRCEKSFLIDAIQGDVSGGMARGMNDFNPSQNIHYVAVLQMNIDVYGVKIPVAQDFFLDVRDFGLMGIHFGATYIDEML